MFKTGLRQLDPDAYVREAAPRSTVPNVDENAVTKSAMTTMSSSLFHFQSAIVLSLTKN